MDRDEPLTLVGPDGHRFGWHDGWAELPDDAETRAGWAHHALVTTRDGSVVGFHPADGTIVVRAPDGTVERTLHCGLIEGHGATIIEQEDGTEVLWVADAGFKMVPSHEAPTGYGPRTQPGGPAAADLPGALAGARGRVLAVGLSDGRIVTELPTPQHERYDHRPFLPTAVAAAPDGTVWVADGYGASMLHRFAPDGRQLRSITGEESAAGPLRVPHGLLIDRRHGKPELYVADRENRRLVVLDVEGEFLREVAPGQLERPCAMAVHGDLLAVAELRARVALLDLDDRLVGTLGANTRVADVAGWPNGLDDGTAVRPAELTPGRFHAPHGITTDVAGNLYVAEWLIGGRYTKLVPVARAD
ncbi:MAG TPA: hypothetical protein VGA69_10680 [Nitriliruptorales bacterium]